MAGSKVDFMKFYPTKDKGYVAVGEVGIVINKQPLRIRAADVVYLSKEKCPDPPKGMLKSPRSL